MTNYSSHRKTRAERRGFALIVVLCFVVLLTAVVVAFFSNATIQRQVANSSANGTKAGLFARGALDSIVGDLKQEIVDGSQATTITTASGNSTYYTPTASSTGYYPTMVPYRAGSDSSWTNLIKQSAYGVAFHPNGNGYAQAGSTRAANVLTTQPSTNGRYYSIPRWNKALLLPPTSATDFTPATTKAFTAPNWILVAQDGSDTHALTAPPQPTATNAVAGRYAYCIYDEGGLLDANVAGFTTPANSQVSYKNAQAYADLTQLTDAGGNACLTQAQINALVSWRNAATLQQPSVWPQPNGSSQPDGYYANYVATNPTGFLKTANTTLPSGQSDHMFTGRQQLINFFTYNLGGGFALEKALQYLGTFSRDLNQPSYVRLQATNASSTLDYNSSVPKILSSSQGGNDASGGDDKVNPSFPLIRVVTSFPRPDGTTAQVGEPLVKKRFALSRLAWLTYQGPSQMRNLTNPTATGPDADIYSLENSYGISQAWLQQGTAANIQAYFGLTWGTNPTNSAQKCWSYVHGSSSNTINALYQVAQLSGANAREPDFVELLKAAINAGSIAKPSTLNNTTGTFGYNYQYALDSSTDYAVMQIFANIMGQSSTDGYPPAIYFPIPTTVFNGMFYGEKNLPCLNRVRTMVIKAKEPVLNGTPLPYGADYTPPWTEALSTTNHYYPPPFAVTTTNKISDTGIGLAMLYPELWNPHDWNPNNVNQTLGNPHPTQFAVTAQSDLNVNQGIIALVASTHGPAPSPLTGVPNQSTAGVSQSNANPPHADPTDSPGFVSRGFTFQTSGRSLKESETEMDFSLPGDTTDSTFFREPTLLFKPGVPSGLNLKGTGLATLTSSTPLSQFKAPGTGGGLMSGVTSGSVPYANGDAELMDPINQGYIGFYLGAFPLWFSTYYKDLDSASPTYLQLVPIAYPATCVANVGTNSVQGNPASVATEITYLVKCQDANGQWIPYDQKYGDLNPAIASGALMLDRYKGFFNPECRSMPYAMTIDPRSSRFGLINAINPDNGNTAGGIPSPEDYFPPFVPGSGDTVGWLSRPNAIISTQREGESAGATLYIYSSSYLGPNTYDSTWNDWWMTSTLGWYPGSGKAGTVGPFLYTGTPSRSLRPGLLTQNNPSVVSDGMAYDNAPAQTYAVSQYYADADGVVRRAMAAYVPGTASSSGPTPPTGLPMATANNFVTPPQWTTQSQGRPMILNRPFRSVAELGYVFTGTPWKNIDFFTPESGAAALLDVFCVNDTDNSAGLVAGKVNLNTRQIPVLQTILAGAYLDESNSATSTIPGSLAQTVAQGLVTRTGSKPLVNPSELVGKWVSSVSVSGVSATDGSKSYDGFSADLSTLLPSGTDQNVQRYREATIRALANAGQTRLWNLMIDCVAQVGRYPAGANSLSQFNVEGEQRFWVHVSIDRFTGQVVDKQIEMVKE